MLVKITDECAVWAEDVEMLYLNVDRTVVVILCGNGKAYMSPVPGVISAKQHLEGMIELVNEGLSK